MAEPDGATIHYRLLETLRQFASERLIEYDEREAATIAARHCEYFLRVAEAAAPHLHGPAAAAWFERLDRDQAQRPPRDYHAVDDPERTALALRFATALQYYWFTRSRRYEAFAWIITAIKRPEARRDPELLARATLAAAGCATVIDGETVRRLSDQAVQLARQLDHVRIGREVPSASTRPLISRSETGGRRRRLGAQRHPVTPSAACSCFTRL